MYHRLNLNNDLKLCVPGLKKIGRNVDFSKKIHILKSKSYKNLEEGRCCKGKIEDMLLKKYNVALRTIRRSRFWLQTRLNLKLSSVLLEKYRFCWVIGSINCSWLSNSPVASSQSSGFLRSKVGYSYRVNSGQSKLAYVSAMVKFFTCYVKGSNMLLSPARCKQRNMRNDY